MEESCPRFRTGSEFGSRIRKNAEDGPHSCEYGYQPIPGNQSRY
jgi:hypothetical protein